MRRLAGIFLIAAPFVLLGACGGDDDSDSKSATGGASGATAGGTSSSDGGASAEDGGSSSRGGVPALGEGGETSTAGGSQGGAGNVNPVSCPANEPQSGSTCDNSRSQECLYGEVGCWCIDDQWRCDTVDLDCPEEVPESNVACTGLDGTTCIYNQRVCICPEDELWLCSGEGSHHGQGGASNGGASNIGVGGAGSVECPADAPEDDADCGDVSQGTDCYYDDAICICRGSGTWQCNAVE